MENRQLETPQGIRTETVLVRLTPEEKALLFQEAKQAGISISAFVRLLFRNWTNGVNFTKKAS